MICEKCAKLGLALSHPDTMPQMIKRMKEDPAQWLRTQGFVVITGAAMMAVNQMVEQYERAHSDDN